jgi:hypothetical protein
MKTSCGTTVIRLMRNSLSAKGLKKGRNVNCEACGIVEWFYFNLLSLQNV